MKMIDQIRNLEREVVYNHARLYLGEGDDKRPHISIGRSPTERHPIFLVDLLNELEIPFNTDDHQSGVSPGTMPYLNGQGYAIVSMGRCRRTEEGLEIYEFFTGQSSKEPSIENLAELQELMPETKLITVPAGYF